MAVYEVKQKGDNPIWEFKCPFCGEEWSEVYLDGSDMQVRDVSALRSNNSNEKTFIATKQCRCCGLLVWSKPIIENKIYE